jgi:low affinity Fe/Cu permease
MSFLRRLALVTPQVVGSPRAFLVVIVAMLGWLGWGAAAGWSDSWLLWPSAVASVITLVIAFSLQYTQNRDTRAIQLKLDEILRASDGARREMIKLERLPDVELERAEEELLNAREPSSGD